MSYSLHDLREEFINNTNKALSENLIKDKLRNTSLEIISEDGLIYQGLDGIECIEIEAGLDHIKPNRKFKVR